MADYNDDWGYAISLVLPQELQLDKHDGDPKGIIVMQRACKPAPSKAFQHLIDIGAIVGLCEYDDSLWNIDKDNYAREYYDNPELQENLIKNLQVAHGITVSTRALGEQIVDLVPEASGKTFVLPNNLPAWTRDLPIREHHGGEEPVRIVYPASANHLGDAKIMGDAIKKLLSKYPGKVEFWMQGADFCAQFKIDRDENCFWYPWYYTMEAYYSSFAEADIVIAPLMHTEFNEAKSDIKALEAWRAHVPIVASNWGPYNRSVTDGHDGFLIDEDDEKGWFEALRELTFNHDRRKDMGEAGHETLTTTGRFWDEAAPMWDRFYRDVWKDAVR